MTAKEVREYRNVSKKLAESEERSKLYEDLKKNRVCLAEDEMYTKKLSNKFKVLGSKQGEVMKQHEEMVSLTLKYKMRDNIHHMIKLRRRRDWLRRRISNAEDEGLGVKKIFEEVGNHVRKMKTKMREKNKKKVQHLTEKFGRHSKLRWGDIDKEVRDTMGNPRMFNDDVRMEGEMVRNPVFVEWDDENIHLSDDELDVLRLGPKFCLLKSLDEEDFETDLEECIMKIKWDMMSEDGKKQPGEEEIAWRIALGAEVCDQIDDELEEESELVEAGTRSIMDWEKKTLNLARRRATDVKRNSRVNFPRKARNLEQESALQTLRMELLALFRQYRAEKCDSKGRQEPNLTKAQGRGLRSILKRVKGGELVIIPTDKSGNLAVMSLGTYIRAGMKHTLRDRAVGWEDIKNSQRELNGHVSMMIKIFKIGSYWEHGLRIRESMMGENQSICPLSLLFKDHKGWTAGMGTVPPTRPVAGGHLGINLHISEIVSDILDPIVDDYIGGKEIISTEDGIARLELVNESNVGWSRNSFWRGMVEGEYKACSVCTGVEGYVWDDEYPELCTCKDMDGFDDEGRILVSMGAMR